MIKKLAVFYFISSLGETDKYFVKVIGESVEISINVKPIYVDILYGNWTNRPFLTCIS